MRVVIALVLVAILSACAPTEDVAAAEAELDSVTCSDDHTVQTRYAFPPHTVWRRCTASQLCTTAGGLAPHCASTTCVGSVSTVPRAHGVCLANGQLAHCDAQGLLGAGTACASGATCEAGGGTASCVAPRPPPVMHPDAAMPAADAGTDGGTDAGNDAGLNTTTTAGTTLTTSNDGGAFARDVGSPWAGDGGVPFASPTPYRPIVSGCTVAPGADGRWSAMLLGLAAFVLTRRRPSRS